MRIIYSRVFAKVRNTTFYSLAALNQVIGKLLITHNQMSFRGRDYSRESLFSEIEKAQLHSLPTQRFAMKTYYQGTVQWDDRHNRKMERLTKAAKFRYKASAEEVLFDQARGLDKNQLQRFFSGEFIRAKENILLTGSTGVGKSYVASAIGHQACSLGYKVRYCNTNKLFTELKTAKADGSYIKEVNKIEKQDLLILAAAARMTSASNR